MVYFNNILIYSNDIANYTKYIKQVLYYLWKARLYIKAKKYKFNPELVEYLEYIFFSSKLTIANNKIKIIKD